MTNDKVLNISIYCLFDNVALCICQLKKMKRNCDITNLI